MNLQELITSEAALTIIATVFGGIWTLFKGSGLYARLQERRMKKALRILESAVESTYRTYVRQIKKARRDGKLTPEEARHAHRIAKAKALRIARRKGLNLARILGREFLDLAITRTVHRLKSRT